MMQMYGGGVACPWDILCNKKKTRPWCPHRWIWDRRRQRLLENKKQLGAELGREGLLPHLQGQGKVWTEHHGDIGGDLRRRDHSRKGCGVRAYTVGVDRRGV